MKKILVFIHCLLSCILIFAQPSQKLQLNKNNIKQVVAAMTLEEKARMVVGTGNRSGALEPLIGNADGRVSGSAGNTFSIERLGVPGTVLADGPAGLRIEPFRNKDSSISYYATAWPVGTLLASSWDTALLKKVGAAFGNEIKEYGIDVILAPGMNIHRDPLCGRNFEYYSEDPLIAGYMASAIVNGIQSNGVGVSIKHFAANNQETNRLNINAIISERALREIYLKGFEIVVKHSNPLTVMSSYNKINGTYTSENKALLTNILRKEWGFKGYVMTDWLGGKDPIAQLKAGNDLIMPGNINQVNDIVKAVNDGLLNVKILDEDVAHILAGVVQSPSFQHYKYSNKPNLKAHAQLARAAAAEGMVLLKNENHILPIKKNLKLVLFGNTSYEPIIGGTGSGDVNEAYSISLADGMSLADYGINNGVKRQYQQYMQSDRIANPKRRFERGFKRMVPELFISKDSIIAYSKTADMAIFSIGRNAGEGVDRKLENDFYLSDSERIALKNISEIFHAEGKKMIVVLNICGPMETASWRDIADAILLAYQPGQEAGNAIADILTGKINPSGKLATTFPMKYEDAPSAKNFPGTPAEKPTDVTYEEGIYVGYRHYNTNHIQPAYEFGYGLSYTNFSYSNIKLSSSSFSKKLTVDVTITNTGTTAGKEVVQMYIHAPAKKLDKPTDELKAFAKTRLLAPGQSQTLQFEIQPEALTSFDIKLASWVAEAGVYTIKIGASSTDIKGAKTFNLAKEMVMSVGQIP